jgi:hypothetical protein
MKLKNAEEKEVDENAALEDLLRKNGDLLETIEGLNEEKN